MLDDEDQPAPRADDAEDPWNQRFYDRGTQGFERVVLFSDAVYAISLTLIGVQLVVPALNGLTGSSSVGEVISEGLSNSFAYAFTFIWVAFYWKANHRFTLTLRRMDSPYIWAVLVYLAFIALLPFPAAVLGEEWDPQALAFFFVYMAILSGLETVLGLIAIRNDLLVRKISAATKRQRVLRSLSPVIAALISAPLCFVTAYGNWIAIVTMTVVSTGLSTWVTHHYRAQSGQPASGG